MGGIVGKIGTVALLLVAVAISGTWNTYSSTDSDRIGKSTSGLARQSSQRQISRQGGVSPLSYRSPGATHKLLVPSDEASITDLRRQARRATAYGAYTLLEVSDETLAAMSASFGRAQLRDDLNLILLRRGQIDTTAAAPQVRADLRLSGGADKAGDSARSLHLVQLFGPPTPSAVRRLQSSGARIISYVPNNAYLLYGSRAQLERLRGMKNEADVVQWESPFHPAYKIDPRVSTDSVEQVRLSIELIDVPGAEGALATVKSVARAVLMPEFRAAGTIHIKVLTEAYNVAQLARLGEVLAIEPWGEVRRHDERANQIVAGVTVDETVNNVRLTRPANPGYLTFLTSLGFTSNFDFAVDIGDTGLDRGSATLPNLHRDFLDQAGNSRIAYLHDFTFTPTASPAHDPNGHGTLNASIVGGYNVGAGSQFSDNLGYQYGLGVAPFVRIGASRLFNDDGDFIESSSFGQVLNLAYSSGARISNNSWGICIGLNGFCNIYSHDSRVYDALVRDTDPNSQEYQQMVVVFSAGNDGASAPQVVSIPGTAKNVITVGASEGFRATGANGEPLQDGCDVPAVAADNAQDVVIFSSGGPVQDGRNKPDLVAPGTHITGAATQSPLFASKSLDEIGTCDFYYPAGQTLYTWSSGTSHAAPLVSGGAALAFQWLKTRLSKEPSPALVKAFLLNSTSYLTGRNSNDSLPGARQGWGLLNISRMFETTDRIIYDQAPERVFNESGGAPFETTGVITDPTKEFRVMLAYTDAPGVGLSNAPYVNQLNLEVVVGGVVYHGNVFEGPYSKTGGQADVLNNVQGVRLPAGTTGPFLVRVRPTIIAGDGLPFNGVELDQDFALVVSNGRETATPILSVDVEEVTVTHANNSTDRSLIPGETAIIKIGVHNASPTVAANGSQATLSLIGTSVSSQARFPAIPAGGTLSNETAFSLAVPANLRCGATAELRLQLDTELGKVTLPVRLQVGRTTSSVVVLDDDVDSARVKWKTKKGFSISESVGLSGRKSYRAVDPGLEERDQQLSLLFTKKAFLIPENAANVRMSFYHIFNFEPGFDGGVLEISTDDGVSWLDMGTRVLSGGYDGKVTAASENPLGNRFAWTSRGKAGVFSRVVVNLDEFAGQRIRLRFLAGFDGATGIRDGYQGWFIDDIKITADSSACQ